MRAAWRPPSSPAWRPRARSRAIRSIFQPNQAPNDVAEGVLARLLIEKIRRVHHELRPRLWNLVCDREIEQQVIVRESPKPRVERVRPERAVDVSRANRPVPSSASAASEETRLVRWRQIDLRRKLRVGAGELRLALERVAEAGPRAI